MTLLIGGSSDLGCELIRRLDRGNERVIAHCFRSEGKLQKLQSELKNIDLQIQKADLANFQSINDLLSRLHSEDINPTNLVFFAAPKFHLTRFKDLTWDNFQVEIDLQLRPTFEILQRCLPLMSAKKSGRVVFVLSSVTEGIPPLGTAAYTTIKFALLGMMRSLAGEYAKKGVNINAVSPSMIETQFLSQLPERMVELAAEQAPRGRNATPQDVVGAIEFLLSDSAAFVTCQNISISGGQVF